VVVRKLAIRLRHDGTGSGLASAGGFAAGEADARGAEAGGTGADVAAVGGAEAGGAEAAGAEAGGAGVGEAETGGFAASAGFAARHSSAAWPVIAST
jgi:hypothetical protein